MSFVDFTDVTILGQLTNASNATLLVQKDDQQYVYKPRSGERELWDFPNGTLYLRERAMFVLSDLIGWNIVPLTQIGHGPLGIGSFQNWLDAEVTQVDIFVPAEVPKQWITVTSGVNEHGSRVTLAHSPSSDLQKIVLLDALANNADRKAGHLLTDSQNKTWAIDHGVTFNSEPKLRTVLWGWLGEPIPDSFLADLDNLDNRILGSELLELLTPEEIETLLSRAKNILVERKFPMPSPNWPAVPWPIF